MQNKNTMLHTIGEPAMLEQFAEEAAELAKAALKLARVKRGENPTPVTEYEASQMVLEEYTDVVQCAEELGLIADRNQMERKHGIFLARQAEQAARKR